MSSNNNHPPVGQMTSTSGLTSSSTLSGGGSSSSGGGGHPIQHIQYPHNQQQQNDQRESTKSFNEKFRAFFKNLGKGTNVVAGGGGGLGVQGPGGG